MFHAMGLKAIARMDIHNDDFDVSI
jgi:hypothetical protein